MMKTTNEADDRSAMSMKEDDLQAELCKVFGIFPEELEYNLNVTVGKNTMNKLMQLITERDAAIRIDENRLFWNEALDIYHGIPIDTEAWWYKYHMARVSELEAIKRKEEV